jgi:predicted dehydrogenase
MYKGAMVGFGNVASQAHVPAWRTATAAQIVAVVDPVPACQAQAQALLPGVRYYARLETMLEREELDFLDICTPPAMHDQIIMHACRRGLHVLCEKPLTVSGDALQQIVTAATAADVLIFPVHNWKYAPLFQALKRLLDTGDIGTPTYVELTTLRTKPAGTSGWRVDPAIAGGGILMDHGWHAFYLLMFLLGETPQTIAARLEKRRWQQVAVEDTATCDVTFPHARARIHLTWAASQRRNTGVVRGSSGDIRLEDTHLVVQSLGQARREMHFPESLSVGSYHPDWFAALLPDFYAALDDPRQRSRSLQEAEMCLRLTLLAYQSTVRQAQPLSYAQALHTEVA